MKNTEKSSSTVKSKSRNPFAPKTEILEKYGELKIILKNDVDFEGINKMNKGDKE